MWTTVFLAQSRKEAKKVERVLSDEGVLVKLRSVGTQSVSEEQLCVEILVPQSEVKEAHEIIQSKLTYS
jgi:galactitol-specific phosphotransferase system IIB component